MKLVDAGSLRGPSPTHHEPTTLLVIDLSDTEMGQLRNGIDRLAGEVRKLVPELRTEDDAFTLSTPDVPAALGLIPAIALTLQNLRGSTLRWGQVIGVPQRAGRFRISFAQESAQVGSLAARLAARYFEVALQRAGGPTSLAGSFDPSKLQAARRRLESIQMACDLGNDARALMEAATRKGLPRFRLRDDNRFIQIGYGVHAKRFRGTERITDVRAEDAEVTRRLRRSFLKPYGIPLPQTKRVADASQAIEATESIGWPVRVRSVSDETSSGKGRLVAHADELRQAMRELSSRGSHDAILEWDEQPTHRFLIVGGEVVAIADLDGDSLPNEVHPDNRELALLTAAYAGLEIAAIDLHSPSLAVPWRESKTVVCDVSPAPDLDPFPTQSLRQAAADAILDHWFPASQSHDLPIAAVTGTDGKTTTCRMLTHVLRGTGKCVGLADSDQARIGPHRALSGDQTGFRGARAVLSHPEVELAVLETGRGGILSRGVGFSRCTVGAVLNVREDHLGELGVRSLEDLATAKRLVPELATRHVVLNADDTLCLKMREHLGETPTCLVAPKGPSEVIQRHLATGGRAAYLIPEEGDPSNLIITLQEGDTPQPILPLKTIPATWEGRVRHNGDNALFAAAIAWCLDCPLELIRERLATFESNLEQNPGRLNLLTDTPATVIVDYGHNPGELDAVIETVRQLPIKGQRHCLLAAAPNRDAKHFTDMAASAARFFDRLICTNGVADPQEERVPAALGAGLISAGLDASQFDQVPDAKQALDQLLDGTEEGDLVVIFQSHPELCRDQVEAWKQRRESSPEPDAPAD